jgi:hypothetical protein
MKTVIGGESTKLSSPISRRNILLLLMMVATKKKYQRKYEKIYSGFEMDLFNLQKLLNNDQSIILFPGDTLTNPTLSVSSSSYSPSPASSSSSQLATIAVTANVTGNNEDQQQARLSTSLSSLSAGFHYETDTDEKITNLQREVDHLHSKLLRTEILHCYGEPIYDSERQQTRGDARVEIDAREGQ